MITAHEEGLGKIRALIASAEALPVAFLMAQPSMEREGERVLPLSRKKKKREGAAAEEEPALVGPTASLLEGDNEIIDKCIPEPLNDTGNGKRLLYHFGDNILHVREVGWHSWTGTHWERDGADQAVERYAQITAARIALEADRLSATRREADAIAAGEKAATELLELRKSSALLTEEQRATEAELEGRIRRADYAKEALAKRKVARRKYAISSGNGGKIESMIKRAIPHRTVSPTDLDVDIYAFNVENGTLRFIKTLDEECPDTDLPRYAWSVRLDKHKPSDLISKCAPVKYDPASRAPRWRAFLEECQPNKEVRLFLRDYHGYALTGLREVQAFIYNWGSGANGKSSFIEALARCFGGYAQTLNPESFTGTNQRRGDQATPDLADLVNARLLRVSELPERSPLQDNLVKALTGGEPMKVRHLQMRFFLFWPCFKASMSGNNKPEINDISEGMWRRLFLVPWTVMIPPDRRLGFEELQRIFEGERAGILNWLIEGALAYFAAGNKLTPPADVVAATAEHREERDPAGQFVDAVIVGALGEELGAGTVYEHYLGWAYESGVRPVTQTKLGRDLVKHKIDGVPIARGRSKLKRTVVYLDIAIRPGSPEPRTPQGASRGLM